MELGQVNSGIVHMKCIEVRSDYQQQMQRLQFRRTRMPEAETKELAKSAFCWVVLKTHISTKLLVECTLPFCGVSLLKLSEANLS